MRKQIIFDEEELLAIAVFTPDTRMNTVSRMDEAVPELAEDAEMRALLVSAREKLKLITDEEYKDLDLQKYREDLEWSEEDEEE